MSTVPEQLRQAREAQNLTVHQVADTTKIRTDHIEALEAGDYDTFSAPVYIRGFVRTYARLLKLNVPAILTALDEELNATAKFAEPPSLSGKPGSIVDRVMLELSKVDLKKGIVSAAILVTLVVLVTIYLTWQHQRHSDPLSGLEPDVYQSTQSVSGDRLPLPRR